MKSKVKDYKFLNGFYIFLKCFLYLSPVLYVVGMFMFAKGCKPGFYSWEQLAFIIALIVLFPAYIAFAALINILRVLLSKKLKRYVIDSTEKAVIVISFVFSILTFFSFLGLIDLFSLPIFILIYFFALSNIFLWIYSEIAKRLKKRKNKIQ